MPSLAKTAAYNYTSDTIRIPKNIPQNNQHVANAPNIIVPSFIVSLSQSIISFILRRISRLPLIGTKGGEIREFAIDEFHILIITLLCFSIHYTQKYRNKSRQYKQHLHTLLNESKIHNFSTLAAVDYNNIKRIECLYYKNEFQMYDIDLLTRTELRTFIRSVMSQCEVLSGLSLKILETINAMFKQQRLGRVLRLHNKNKKNTKNNNKLVQRQNEIEEYYDGQEETVDKYQSFFDEKNNEQYLTENRDQQRQATEKEITESFKNQNQQKQIEINAVKLSNNEHDVNNIAVGCDDQKMTEEEDAENKVSPLQKRRESAQLAMKYDHEYLKKQANNLPIQQIDFSCKEISRYNLQKEVNNMKYDIILSEESERRSGQIRKYAVISCIIASTVFTYWYSRHYRGKGITQKIRDTQSRFFSYF